MVEQATRPVPTLTGHTAVTSADAPARSTWGRCPGCGHTAELRAAHDGVCAWCFHHPAS